MLFIENTDMCKLPVTAVTPRAPWASPGNRKSPHWTLGQAHRRGWRQLGAGPGVKGGQGDLHPQPRGLGAGGPSPAAEWEEVLGGFSRPRGVQGSAVWGAAWLCVRHVLGTSADSAQISSWLESLSFPELQGISWEESHWAASPGSPWGGAPGMEGC